MEELYRIIEQKIKRCRISKSNFRWNGLRRYLRPNWRKREWLLRLLSKVEDDVIFEYHITVMDDEFNLGLLTIRTPEGVFETDFDK